MKQYDVRKLSFTADELHVMPDWANRLVHLCERSRKAAFFYRRRAVSLTCAIRKLYGVNGLDRVKAEADSLFGELSKLDRADDRRVINEVNREIKTRLNEMDERLQQK